MSATTATTAEATRRPTLLSAAVAVLAGLVAVGLLFPADSIRTTLLAELCGVALLGAGLDLRSRGRAFAGFVLAIAGGFVVVGSVARAATTAGDLAVLLRLLPGMLGVLLLSVGVFPVSGAGSRGLVKLGSAVVFAAVVASGVFQAVAASTLLLAGVAAVVAWDAGENAINVGEHLGRKAATSRVELLHVGASAAVGALAVLGGNLVRDAGTPSLSLPALATLLVAAILLVAALHE